MDESEDSADGKIGSNVKRNIDRLNLERLLEAFSAPINEEQSWAVCYQCAKYLQSKWEYSPGDCCVFNGINSVELTKEGNVSNIVQGSERVESEFQLTQCLGVLVFLALDYGLSETEEQRISAQLKTLIEKMTGSESDDEDEDMDGDEGIEHDSEDDISRFAPKFSLQDVIQYCSDHVQAPMEAASHYKAVCRALVHEAAELITFLENMSCLKEASSKYDSDEKNLEDLERADWISQTRILNSEIGSLITYLTVQNHFISARIWIQVMRDLRLGVKLKKVTQVQMQPEEYELTPYEILMEDIRSRRYTLNKVLISEESFCNTKKDAHDVILDFIRSRPPLQPAKNRKLAPLPPREPDLREQLHEAIRAVPKLRPVASDSRIVETSRTKLNESDGTPAPAKKIIKPDPILFLSGSSDDEDDDDEDELDDRNKVSPTPLTPFTPLSPKTPSESSWQQKAAVARRAVTFCQSPLLVGGTTSPLDSFFKPCWTTDQRSQSSDQLLQPKCLQPSLECLSLTVEEVMHIRSVLTKAELECLILNPELHDLVSRGKVCFTCKRTRFSLFGKWGTKCKFCSRNVCSKCVTKMRIPTEHFEHIPVYTLSPSPVSADSSPDLVFLQQSGSAPSSPDGTHRAFVMQSPEPDLLRNGNSAGRGRSRAPMLRAQTVTQSLQGPAMSICIDCKAMVLNIIRASRSSLALAPSIAKDNGHCESPSRKPIRNFHLDLKPVYK